MFGNDKVIGLVEFLVRLTPKIWQEFRTSTPSHSRSTYAREICYVERLYTLIPTPGVKSWIFFDKNSSFEWWKFSKTLVIFCHVITPMR